MSVHLIRFAVIFLIVFTIPEKRSENCSTGPCSPTSPWETDVNATGTPPRRLVVRSIFILYFVYIYIIIINLFEIRASKSSWKKKSNFHCTFCQCNLLSVAPVELKQPFHCSYNSIPKTNECSFELGK